MQNEEPTETVSTAPRYHVHVYSVIRTKVAVAATDHRSAMETADALLFGEGMPVALVPRSSRIEEVEHADEVTGYLVDEIGDEHHLRTRSYGPDHEPEEVGGPAFSLIQGEDPVARMTR